MPANKQPIRKITGNYVKIVDLFGKHKDIFGSEPANLYKESTDEEVKAALKVDIKRINTLDDTLIEDLSSSILQEENLSPYTQGDLTAEVFAELTYQSYRITKKDGKELESACKAKQAINFAYFSDDNTMCGFSCVYDTTEPDQWIISIIKNTRAVHENREVTNFVHGEILEDITQNTEKVQVSEFQKQLNKTIGSQKVTKFLQGIIDESARVNSRAFSQISSELNFRSKLRGLTKVKLFLYMIFFFMVLRFAALKLSYNEYQKRQQQREPVKKQIPNSPQFFKPTPPHNEQAPAPESLSTQGVGCAKGGYKVTPALSF